MFLIPIALRHPHWRKLMDILINKNEDPFVFDHLYSVGAFTFPASSGEKLKYFLSQVEISLNFLSESQISTWNRN